jgi:hypothetical protein
VDVGRVGDDVLVGAGDGRADPLHERDAAVGGVVAGEGLRGGQPALGLQAAGVGEVVDQPALPVGGEQVVAAEPVDDAVGDDAAMRVLARVDPDVPREWACHRATLGYAAGAQRGHGFTAGRDTIGARAGHQIAGAAFPVR